MTQTTVNSKPRKPARGARHLMVVYIPREIDREIARRAPIELRGERRAARRVAWALREWLRSAG